MEGNDGRQRVKGNLRRAISRYIRETPIDVLVLGPSLEGTDEKPSAVLRREILERCGGYGAQVRGEDAHLLAEAEELVGAEVHNLCSYELTLAEDVCDVVVIVPDSPGSFAELGLFAMASDRICAKTIVLFDRCYRDCDSYLMQGPRRYYEMRGARVAFVDYDDVESAWRTVRAFLHEVRQKKRDRSLFG